MVPEPVKQAPLFGYQSWLAWRWFKRTVGGLFLTTATILAVRSMSHRAGTASVDASRITLATAVQGTFERDITGDSVVGARLRQTLTAAWNGTISFRVRGGDTIKSGQLLATIESPDLESRLLQERAQLEALVADTKRAEVEERKQREINRDNYRLALVEKEEAARDLLRKRRAYEMGAYSEIDVLRGEDTVRRTQIELERAQSLLRLDSTRLQLEERSRALARERQALLVKDLERHKEQLSIRSAVSGQVAQVLIADHAAVLRDAPVISVIDLSSLELDLKLPQAVAGEIQPGSKASVTNGAESYEAQVVAMSPEIVGGEILIRLQFTGASPLGLRQGQRLPTRLVLERHPNVLLVQRGPFVEESGGRYVYVVRGNRAVRRPIQIAAIGPAEVEIAEGLRAGESVIVDGVGQVSRPEISIVRIAGRPK